MQAFPAKWIPPTGVLGRIIHETSRRVATARGRRSDLEIRARAAEVAPDFFAALRGDQVKVIAEVKRRSPSRGDINAQLDPASHAREYERGGAAAISVLTEPTHFAGSGEDLMKVRDAVNVPLLRKDFIVDEMQIIEARAWGASAVLLIARALPPADLVALADAARDWGLEPLIEVRTDDELHTAMNAHARLVGVNSRDLETLEVNADAIDRLVPRVPPHVVAVAESGMQTVADVERAAEAGADAVLIGSSLSVAADPAAAVRALVGVPRRHR
ncbi:MAG TPA: indole-3-glycerol phosphate synthase TrpC [Gemmatimonadaceae bacterium]|nr:indole-3-glycerol phosphate synthase TrpC [Gemmatimonadaceae bacterium]